MESIDVVLMLLSGALISHQTLPRFLQQVAQVAPLTHVMKMANAWLTGGAWQKGHLVAELAVGFGWFVVSGALMQVAVRRAVRRMALS